MRRLLIPLTMLLFAALTGVQAQTRPAQVGDPPVAARIQIGEPDRFGFVTLSGASGAVFPNAYIGVRNLWTGETVYTRAGITGAFSAQIAGTADAPYWISPSGLETPRERRQTPGSMPGGPGTIIQRPIPSPDTADRITQIALDADLADWETYPEAVSFGAPDGAALLALRNNDSLYVALDGVDGRGAGNSVQIVVTIDRITYQITLPTTDRAAPTLERLNPNQAALGAVSAALYAGVNGFEARIPLSFSERADTVRLDAVRVIFSGAPAYDFDNGEIDALIPETELIDGIVRPADDSPDFTAESPYFTIGGGGLDEAGLRATWTASGRAESLRIAPGESIVAQLDVTLRGIAAPPDAEFLWSLTLSPAALADGDGAAVMVNGEGLDNGWTRGRTPSGVPIDALRPPTIVGVGAVPAHAVVRREADGGAIVAFPVDFAFALPADAAPGLYTLTLRGAIASLSDPGRAPIGWGTVNTARLPVLFEVGEVETVRLPLALFADDPSDGSRGVLPIGGADGGLSNRVRTNAPTLILPPFTPTVPRRPITYAIEPYVPPLLPNRYDANAVPLIPFDLPGGQITGRVRAPSGAVDDLGNAPIAQIRLSTTQHDEADLFGAASPVDMLRLTTLEPRFTEYTFDEYGEYVINLTARLSDSFGITYNGGGEYRVVVAELLDLMPGSLPGAPYVVGDVINPTLRISPGFPADVTVTVRFYPIDGSAMQEQILSGTADSAGVFLPDQPPLNFQQPGEYVIEYEARFTAVDGALWAGSLRAAGVVAAADDAWQAHGARGVDQPADFRPAWFDLARYAEVNGFEADDAALFPPYHIGDLVWLQDGVDGDMRPRVRLEDRGGLYLNWLNGARPDAPADESDPDLAIAASGAARNEIAIAQEAGYSYISVTRPNATLLQTVLAGDGGGLDIVFNADDPLNRQIGAGIDGMLPGDLFFTFAGTVLRLPDAPALTAGYAAAGTVIATDADPGERVMPPARGLDGGADGGPLLTFNGADYDAVIVPTALQAGDVLTLGEPFLFAGQVAPTLPARVRVTYTKPSGAQIIVEETANKFGGFFEVGGLQVADEPGLWTAQVEVILSGRTSAGTIEPPGVLGTVAGARNGRFTFAVIPPENEFLPWSGALRDSIIAIGLPYNFNFTAPPTWTNVRARVVLTTPGYVLEDADMRVSGRSFSYQYRAGELYRPFSIIERDVRTPGAHVSDTRTLTFIATGLDANGAPAIQTRSFTLLHDRLVTYP